MGWIKYIPVVICAAKAVQQIVEEVEKAKGDDGKISADEVLEIIKSGITAIVDCLMGVVKK